MVLTLLIPARLLYKLHDIITWNHIDVMCKIVLLTGSMVGYSYLMEGQAVQKPPGFGSGYRAANLTIQPGASERRHN